MLLPGGDTGRQPTVTWAKRAPYVSISFPIRSEEAFSVDTVRSCVVPEHVVFMGVLPHNKSLYGPIHYFHIRGNARFVKPQVLTQLTEVLPEKWTWCLEASWGAVSREGSPTALHRAGGAAGLLRSLRAHGRRGDVEQRGCWGSLSCASSASSRGS